MRLFWPASMSLASVLGVGVGVALAIGLGGCAGDGPPLGSIPASLKRDNDSQAVYVHQVREGANGSDGDLEPEDEILMIDGMYVRTMSPQELEASLHGPVGSPVSLTLARGDRIVRVELKRTALRGGGANLTKERHADE